MQYVKSGQTGLFAINAQIDTERRDLERFKEHITFDIKKKAGDHIIATIKPGIAYTVITETKEKTEPADAITPEMLRIRISVLCYLNRWQDAEVGDICHIDMPEADIHSHYEQPVPELDPRLRRKFDPVAFTINRQDITLYQRIY